MPDGGTPPVITVTSSYRLSEDKWLVHEDDRIPAIVSEALWEQANRRL